MTGNLQNVHYSFVKIDGRFPSIDVSMTDRKFYSSRPVGYYKVFAFRYRNFAGVDYEDLQAVVESEINEAWSKTNRDTYLGFNIATRKFIFNVNAYMGLKDPDLKTDGELPHSGQASWYEMVLSSSKTDSIITLKTIDGSDVYLKLPEDPRGSAYLKSIGHSTCIEVIKKDVADTTIFKKNNSLFVKSPEDNSVVTIFNNLKDPRGQTDIFDLDKKVFIGDPRSHPPKFTEQIFLYGKPVMYYQDTGISSIVGKSPTTRTGFIKNSTGKTHYKLTETSNLDDIINVGESVSFFVVPKSKRLIHYGYLWGSVKDGSDASFQYITSQSLYDNRLVTTNFKRAADYLRFASNTKPHKIGIDCDLRSYDPRKPFVYTAPKDGVKIIAPYSGVEDVLTIDTTNFLNNLPDGYIAFYYAGAGRDQYVFRHTNAGVKRINITPVGATLSVNPDIPTAFFEKLYDYKGVLIPDHKLTKDQAENGTGFIDVPSNSTLYSNYNDFIVTIMRV